MCRTRLATLFLVFCLPLAAFAQDPADYALVFDEHMTPAAGAETLSTAQHVLARLEDRWLPVRLTNETRRRDKLLGGVYRAAKFLTVDVPQDHMFMVLAHEVFGHGAWFRELGDGEIRYGFDAPIPYGDGDAFTSFNGRFPASPVAMMGVSAAGIEAQQVLADTIAAHAVSRGRLHYREAWLYFESRLTGMTYILSAAPNSAPGHDVADFLRTFADACVSPCVPTTREDMQERALLALGDPLLYYSLYAVGGSYVGRGQLNGPLPMLHLGKVSLLPSLGYALAPYGGEWIVRTALQTDQQSLRPKIRSVSLRVGDTGAGHTWSVGVRLADVARFRTWRIDAAADVWRQPDLLGEQTSAPLHTGAAASITAVVPFPARLRIPQVAGIHVTAGYKLRGYVPGEQALRGAILRIGLQVQ